MVGTAITEDTGLILAHRLATEKAGQALILYRLSTEGSTVREVARLERLPWIEEKDASAFPADSLSEDPRSGSVLFTIQGTTYAAIPSLYSYRPGGEAVPLAIEPVGAARWIAGSAFVHGWSNVPPDGWELPAVGWSWHEWRYHRLDPGGSRWSPLLASTVGIPWADVDPHRNRIAFATAHGYSPRAILDDMRRGRRGPGGTQFVIQVDRLR